MHEVLNEVVVDRGANPYLAKIECWERDTLITKVGPCAQHCRRHGGLLLRIGGVPGDRACGMRPCCGEVSAYLSKFEPQANGHAPTHTSWLPAM